MDIDIEEVKNIEPLKIAEVKNIDPVTIERVENISPAAVHIKELNHIDPISIESLNIRGVRHVEPLEIEKLNITRFPTVNLVVRQAPPLDLNVRRVPPLTIALHQRFEVLSEYLLRGQLFGIECFRLCVTGCTTVVPKDGYRREISRSLNRSYPDVAASGNAGIPSRCQETTSTVSGVGHPGGSVQHGTQHRHQHRFT